MDLNYVVTCQYLLKFHTNYIIILLSTPQIENISHYTIKRYLQDLRRQTEKPGFL